MLMKVWGISTDWILSLSLATSCKSSKSVTIYLMKFPSRQTCCRTQEVASRSPFAFPNNQNVSFIAHTEACRPVGCWFWFPCRCKWDLIKISLYSITKRGWLQPKDPKRNERRTRSWHWHNNKDPTTQPPAEIPGANNRGE